MSVLGRGGQGQLRQDPGHSGTPQACLGLSATLCRSRAGSEGLGRGSEGMGCRWGKQLRTRAGASRAPDGCWGPGKHCLPRGRNHPSLQARTNLNQQSGGETETREEERTQVKGARSPRSEAAFAWKSLGASIPPRIHLSLSGRGFTGP